MIDLQEALLSLVEPPLAPPQPVTDLTSRVRQHRRRRRIGRIVGASVALFSLTSLALLVTTQLRTSDVASVKVRTGPAAVAAEALLPLETVERVLPNLRRFAPNGVDPTQGVVSETIGHSLAGEPLAMNKAQSFYRAWHDPAVGATPPRPERVLLVNDAALRFSDLRAAELWLRQVEAAFPIEQRGFRRLATVGITGGVAYSRPLYQDGNQDGFVGFVAFQRGSMGLGIEVRTGGSLLPDDALRQLALLQAQRLDSLRD